MGWGELSLAPIVAATLPTRSRWTAQHLSGPGAGLGVDIRDGFQLAVKARRWQARRAACRSDRGRRPGQPGWCQTDCRPPDQARQGRLHDRRGVLQRHAGRGQTDFPAKTFYISANAGPSQFAGPSATRIFSVSYQNDNMHEAAGKTVQDKGFKKVAYCWRPTTRPARTR
jgi:branched-chain amino acid transport system substrate-binding protein